MALAATGGPNSSKLASSMRPTVTGSKASWPSAPIANTCRVPEQMIG
jgi:hypothetical protein